LNGKFVNINSWIKYQEHGNEKDRDEKLVLKALQNGMSTVDAFDKFGIM